MGKMMFSLVKDFVSGVRGKKGWELRTASDEKSRVSDCYSGASRRESGEEIGVKTRLTGGNYKGGLGSAMGEKKWKGKTPSDHLSKCGP